MYKENGEDIMSKIRYSFLDKARGFLIINMIVYHLIYDLVFMFNVDIPWFYSDYAYYWQQFIAGTLILISGVTTALSRNNLKKGLKVLGCGLILTIGTYIFMPSETILFGILHFIGTSSLIIYFLKDILIKIPINIGLILFLLLFVITKNIEAGVLGIGDLHLIRLPEILHNSFLGFLLGFPNTSFASGDYFPIIPWIFLIIVGFYLGMILKDKEIKERFKMPILTFVGKNSLIIYMLHQPLIYGLLYLIF